MRNPKVSVLMPVFNAESYLVDAVESMLAQTYSNFELIIIDDGSSDRSLERLTSISKRDARIKLTSRANTGYVVALNEMIAMASGEYVARMDADDISICTRLELQVERLEYDASIVALGTFALLVDPDNRDLCVLDVPSDHKSIDEKHLSGMGGIIAHPSSMIRTSALKAIGGYHTKFWPAEDVDLFLRLAEIGQLANLPTIGIRYRLHFQSTGHENRRVQIRAARMAAIEAHVRRGLSVPGHLLEEAIVVDTDHRMMWAWWALRGKNVATARRYAIRAFLSNPLSKERARLLYCALRGH